MTSGFYNGGKEIFNFDGKIKQLAEREAIHEFRFRYFQLEASLK